MCDPARGVKAYWETINKILNKKKEKVTCIPPLIENDIFLTNFQDKGATFNDLFIKQCSFTDNEGQIPESLRSRTQSKLRHIEIPLEKIVQLINQLDSKKANGCDEMK